jgi:hypothetical protein
MSRRAQISCRDGRGESMPRKIEHADNSLDGILNIGLVYNLPGALAHRNAFYEIAGGDKSGSGYKRPHLLREVTLAVLRGETGFDIIHNAETPLQELATKSRVTIKLETTTFSKTLRP